MGRGPKAYRRLAVLSVACICLSGLAGWLAAQSPQDDDTVIRRVVDMVQLNVAVTDKQGKYVTGLNPADFVISEDGISQKLATFEGAAALRAAADRLLPNSESSENITVTADAAADPTAATAPGSARAASSLAISPVNGAKVFVLFDTSNYMYRSGGFVYAQDAIADFIRSMDGPERIAFYSYSRDFNRTMPLTGSRTDVLRAVRSTVNGSDSALYNALLLTLRDAAQYTGKRAIVAFSNGPDNASMVPPENVAELAQSIGVPIYMISTREARLDPVSTAVFERMSTNTGGRAFFARNWTEESKAFEAVRNDLANLYVLSYYPLPNPNRGWREIAVKLAGQKYRNLTVRTRSGYRPLPVQASPAATPGAPQLISPAG